MLQEPVVTRLAHAHGRSPAQVLLRWGIQQGRSVIPKSTRPERLAENIDVFDFTLSAEDLAALDVLETGQRGGPEPEVVTLADFGRPISEPGTRAAAPRTRPGRAVVRRASAGPRGPAHAMRRRGPAGR